ncbi:MAG: Phosphoribosylamine--glycine ligase [Caldanaerobacter subterraneus]|jgi:phosphoribosylamine--glycine ligase|uniref:phosphoribosylamine--glycine ligase n=1 Tax=unclassified Thermoanaerobacter TaxID=2636821 RepID=UPI0000E1D659|nr:phosphoribosylamine--glycine ligase [Thermoanaerobacter sp. X514]ABY91834.1 phosphoribosylamine--glycine ligase [Thermoanaerobacter sp. X514]KUJ89858.1 MAG: phosphoribosylamine/glycine ligase [Thermoanaerobacter thermocopriae]KUK35151.1 MAG: Phosphoribosylamine--glycine ligase [Caldanaerobacter subterraneus]HAA80086.1 phosphoribosylamine--glycine ligase [Thermoanaerobacter sp.]
MKVLVIGGGGREHAIVHKLSQSPKVDKIYCAPGNAGIGLLAECVDIKIGDIEKLKEFAIKNNIDLTVVGPEMPLVQGIVDEFEKAGLKIFGPNKNAAAIEGSKYFTKHLLSKYNIPTGRFKAFDKYQEAMKFLKETWYPVVMKADGLAQGKGVFIVKDFIEAKEALDLMMKKRIFGASGDIVIIEEMLFGKEASVFAFTDGENILPMVSAMDYKKVYEGDKGPNTGGMGSIAPNPYLEKETLKEVMESILKPVVKALQKEGIVYKGVLYAGLMLTKEGPKVLEFNARFGDPETQVVLPLLKTDLINIIEATIEGKLDKIQIEWEDKKAVCAVAVSNGYPGEYQTGFEITGLEKVKEAFVYHAGTALKDGKIVTSGGRVLAVTTIGDSYEEAREKVYREIEKISFEGMYYRKDIALVSQV